MALTTIQAVYDEARHALEAGKDERAIGLSEHLLESFPYFLEAYRILGESQLNRQELGEATAAFQRVLRSDPENIPVHVGLGVTYERQGKLEQAIQEFERAFEIQPNLAELRNQVLRLYGEAWGKDYAHLRLKKAGLARLYMRSHRYDKAVQELQDVLSQEPQRLDAQVALAESLWRNGQEHEAADLCRSILANDPDVLKANLILGYLLLAAGDPQGRSLWQHAQQLEPTLTTARALFGATLPPVESISLDIAEFDEQAWRSAKEAKVRAEREQREKAERERREQEERERAAMLEPVAAEPVAASSSWLDSVASPAASSKPSAGADDFLMSLLLGGVSSSSPAPSSTPPPVEPVETDFSIDDLGIDIEPFSLEDFDTDTTEERAPMVDDVETRPLSTSTVNLDPPTESLPAVDLDMPMAPFDDSELGLSDMPMAEFDDSDLDLSGIQPFSFDEWNESDLGSLPGMPLDDEPLQPFSFDTSDVQQTAPPPLDDHPTLPTGNRPFSLDELSPDALDAVDTASPSALGRDLPPLPVDDESSGFSWQEPRSRTGTLFSRRPREETPTDDESIFLKMVQKKQTNALPPLDRTTSSSDLDDEAMSFFSHDDIDLRPDSEEADLNPPPAITIGDEAEQDLTPFSLEDLGLSPDEIASLDNTSDLASKPSSIVDDLGPELTPFSLEDLGLSPDEIEALNSDDFASSAPTPVTPVADVEPDLTPFSLEDLGLSPDEIASLNSDAPPPVSTADDALEPLTPFSLEDLGLSPDEIASLNSDDFTAATPNIAAQEDDFGLGDFGTEDELQPFSLSDLGLSADEIASLGGGAEPFSIDDIDTSIVGGEEGSPQIRPSADAIFEALLAIGKRQGFVDLTDIIARYDDPEAHADEIDSIALELYRNGVAIHDGDEVIDMEEMLTEYDDSPSASDEPELTPFSLADLGLTDDEIAALDTNNDGAITPADFPDVTPATASDEPELTPFSLADLGLTDDEIASYGGTSEPPAASDEPELTPFSLTDLGLTDDEIAALDMNNDGAVTPADFPDVTPATASDEPELTPFSLADLGLTDDEIASYGGTSEPPAASDEPEMTPFSLADLGLTDDEIAALDMNNDGAVTPADFPDVTPATADPSEPEMTPFSLVDLGLTDDEIAALDMNNDGAITPADFPDVTPATADPSEPEMTPFSLADLGLTDDEIASYGGTSEPPAASDEPEMTPFSLADLGLTDDEIASLDMNNDGAITPADFPDVTPATASDEPELTPFSLADLGLTDDEIASYGGTSEPPAASDEPELTPFSLADLGLTDDEIASYGGTSEPPAASDEPEMTPFSLADLGLTDDEIAALDMNNDGAITPADFPDVTPATADPSEPEMTPFSLAELGLTDDEIASYGGTNEPPAASDEPELTPFSLADLGLTDDEIAALDMNNDGAITPADFPDVTPATADPSEPEMTPFSLADLGLTDDEIASYGGTSEPPAASDEPELTPFSLADLGLTDDEIAALDMNNDGAITPADFPDVTPATADPSEPEMTPFSLADLGLTDDEIASYGGTNEPPAASDEPEMTPFSLADLGLTDDEIAELGGTGNFETPHEEFDVSDVEPLSLEDLGLHNMEDSFDDDRNLKLSAEELDSLDLALPTPDQYIEPSSVWQDAQEAVDAVIAEEQSMAEPELQPFSFEDLGLSAEEIASLDQGDFGDESQVEAEVPSSHMEPQPSSFHDAPTEPFATAPSTPSAPPASPSETPDLSAYESQLASDPNNHGLRLALARMQGQLGSLDAALTEYKRLIKQGQLLEEIVEDLHDLLEDTTDPTLLQRIHRTLGDTYSKQGRWREAMDEYGWVLNKPRS